MLASYTRPGQYVLIEVPSFSGSGYFAMARAPGSISDGLEFLIKAEGVGRELARLDPGAALGMSDPIGDGFPLDRAAKRNVLLLAAGAGIGPIRAALESMCRDRDRYGWIRLYYGQARVEDFAFREWLESLAEHRVELEQVISGESSAHARGYVQEVADSERNFGEPERLCVLLCGMAEMERDARERCLARGVEAGQILTNF